MCRQKIENIVKKTASLIQIQYNYIHCKIVNGVVQVLHNVEKISYKLSYNYNSCLNMRLYLKFGIQNHKAMPHREQTKSLAKNSPSTSMTVRAPSVILSPVSSLPLTSSTISSICLLLFRRYSYKHITELEKTLYVHMNTRSSFFHEHIDFLNILVTFQSSEKFVYRL